MLKQNSDYIRFRKTLIIKVNFFWFFWGKKWQNLNLWLTFVAHVIVLLGQCCSQVTNVSSLKAEGKWPTFTPTAGEEVIGVLERDSQVLWMSLPPLHPGLPLM